MYEETRQVYVSREMHLASWLIAAVMSLEKSSACGAYTYIYKSLSMWCSPCTRNNKICAPSCLVLVGMLVRAKLFFYSY